jgi:UDPglucose 6-dehydrogenase
MADDFDKYLPKEKRGVTDVPTNVGGEEPPVSLANPFRLGIVGHGFVGSAVDYAFTNPLVATTIVDPKYGTTIDDLTQVDPHCVFVCAPTPMSENHTVDASIVEDVVLKLMHHTQSLVVIKSTVTPDVIDRLYNSMDDRQANRLVYNPEFLTEKSAQEQFVDAKFHVVGGSESATAELMQIYDCFSLCSTKEFYRMSAHEASFVKYGINTYLATKVTFFNQFYDLVNSYQCSYNIITRAMGADSRVGIGHTRVPGYDGKRGFGGACFPKDIAAFLKFSEHTKEDGEKVCFDMIKEVIRINNDYRRGYEKDDREKVNNITFGDDE